MGDSSGLIEGYISAARNAFLALGGWRFADALYLIGSFARGEGTYTVLRGRLHIYNDVDLLAVLPRRSLTRLLGLHRLVRQWKSRGYGEAIDLVVMTEEELLAVPDRVAQADIQSGHRWLWGRPVLDEIPTVREYDLGSGDALQLLLNRQASLMYGLLNLWRGKKDIRWTQVQLSKPLLASMAAELVRTGSYVASTVEQYSRIEGSGSVAPWTETKYEQHLRTAVQFKLAPSAEHFEPFEQTAIEIAHGYFHYLRRFLAWHYGQNLDAPLEVLIKAMAEAQDKQLDVFLPGWWAAWRAVAGARYVPRRPRFDAHPMIGVYSAQLQWMDRWLEDPPKRDVEELEGLLAQWSVSGYGCRLK